MRPCQVHMEDLHGRPRKLRLQFSLFRRPSLIEFITCSTAFTTHFRVSFPWRPVSSPLDLVQCLPLHEMTGGLSMDHFQESLPNWSGHQQLHVLVGPVRPLECSIHNTIDQHQRIPLHLVQLRPSSPNEGRLFAWSQVPRVPISLSSYCSCRISSGVQPMPSVIVGVVFPMSPSPTASSTPGCVACGGSRGGVSGGVAQSVGRSPTRHSEYRMGSGSRHCGEPLPQRSHMPPLQSINQSAWTCYGAPHPKL